MTEQKISKDIIDLRTAQNSMFDFVVEAMDGYERQGKIKELLLDEGRLSCLYGEVRKMVHNLLCIDAKSRSRWHIGIADSGKRAIESLVSFFCPAEKGVNVVVTSENYVAFNKFSASVALNNQKDVEALQPFSLEMGKALTIDCEEQLAKARAMIRGGGIKTLWIGWNSTSTGVQERVERLVEFRNQCQSETLIIGDAASLPLFSSHWQKKNTEFLPDVFFFSLRKQALPYQGPQDEANQARNSGALYVFNSRALRRAKEVCGPSLYDMTTPEEASKLMITRGRQRDNHIRHLLKLEHALRYFLSENGRLLAERDLVRKSIGSEIEHAFSDDGQLTRHGFRLLAGKGCRSETTFVVMAPQGVKPATLIKELKEQNVLVSPSMHPRVPADSYFRFACYPATSLTEVNVLFERLQGLSYHD